MSRGKNCLPTVSRQFLTRDYPRPNRLLKCLPNCLSPTGEGIFSSFKITPAVRVIARQLRDKNCLGAIFAPGHQDVSQGPLGIEGLNCEVQAVSFGTEKTMTARDATGFYAIFSAWKSGNFLHILGRVLTKLNRKPEDISKSSAGENSKHPVETVPRHCKFLSLVVVERVLRIWHFRPLNFECFSSQCALHGLCKPNQNQS